MADPLLTRKPRIPERRSCSEFEPTHTPPPLLGQLQGARRPSSLTAWRNIRMMRLLERLALHFEQARIPLMALKGAALHLLVLDNPGARPMADVDLLVRPQDADRARHLLEQLGGLRGEPLVREDFFPRYHYEVEYSFGTVHPVKIDLHVRPFRPLRYAQCLPDDAFWKHCREVPIGRGRIRVPSTEHMLIHLAVHAAVHGAVEGRWLHDIHLWIETYGGQLDGDRLTTTARQWGLAAPMRLALRRTLAAFPATRLPDAVGPMLDARGSCADILALWQAPRDADHPLAQLLINLLCTRGLRFRLGYLRAILLPHRVHMADWYGAPHRGWLVAAHALRWLGPLATRTPLGRRRLSRIELGPSPIHGIGVFAKQSIEIGEVISQCYGRATDHDSAYAVYQTDQHGETRRFELTGKLRHLSHSCSPNAQLVGSQLRALRWIQRGQEITIDHGGSACSCRMREYRPDSRRRSASARVA